MPYVEFLRVRRIFVRFAIVIVVIVGFTLLSFYAAEMPGGSHGVSVVVGEGQGSSATSQVQSHSLGDLLASLSQIPIPLNGILTIPMIVATIFASLIATSLNRERSVLALIFTKPISRERLALRYFLTDLAGIALAYLLVLALAIAVPFATLGSRVHLVADGLSPWVAILGFGMAFMWFGVLQALTAWYRGNGGAIVGFAWPAAFVLLFLGQTDAFGPLVHGLLLVLNLINPFAYVNGISESGMLSYYAALSLPVRAVLMYGIATLGCAIAIASWNRIEA